MIKIDNLIELIDILNGDAQYTPEDVLDLASLREDDLVSSFDFAHIIGQSHAKRALEIAAAG